MMVFIVYPLHCSVKIYKHFLNRPEGVVKFLPSQVLVITFARFVVAAQHTFTRNDEGEAVLV